MALALGAPDLVFAAVLGFFTVVAFTSVAAAGAVVKKVRLASNKSEGLAIAAGFANLDTELKNKGRAKGALRMAESMVVLWFDVGGWLTR